MATNNSCHVTSHRIEFHSWIALHPWELYSPPFSASRSLSIKPGIWELGAHKRKLVRVKMPAPFSCVALNPLLPFRVHDPQVSAPNLFGFQLRWSNEEEEEEARSFLCRLLSCCFDLPTHILRCSKWCQSEVWSEPIDLCVSAVAPIYGVGPTIILGHERDPVDPWSPSV